MRLPIYQVDAFTDRLFGGNPAAVCPLEAWLPDADHAGDRGREQSRGDGLLRARGRQSYALRWFTPTVEVDLCGHATLAAAMSCFASSSRSATA